MGKKTRPSVEEYFNRAKWTFERSIEGQSSEFVELDWSFVVPGGGRFTDPVHAALRHQLMSFIDLSVLQDADFRMDVGSLPATMTGLRELAIFMIRRKLKSLSLLTSQLSWEFVEELEDQYIAGSLDIGRERSWTYASAYKLIHPLTQIYALGPKLRSHGVDALPEAPFDGKTTYRVVDLDLGLKKGGGLNPIPDRVAIPVLSSAYQWIQYGVDDVIRIQAELLKQRSLARFRGRKGSQLHESMETFLRNYEMATIPETGLPWHEPVLARVRIDDNGNYLEVDTLQSVRRLVLKTIAAASICIQGCAGLRAHELIGLKIAHVTDPLFGIVTLSISADKLMEIFTINGVSAKGDTTSHGWTAGLRPAGTSHQPIPVKAIEALGRLLAPWRELKGVGVRGALSLLVSFTQPQSLPNEGKQVGRMTAMRNSALQREFAADVLVAHYGISIEEAWDEVRSIRPLRWRKTFAHYIYGTKPSLLGALRDHYRHLSERITEDGYIGNDPSLLEDLQGEREMESARLFAEISLGKPVGAGPAQALIKKYTAEAAESIGRMDGDSVLERARAFVEITGFRMWTSNYATCLINVLPSQSRCNPDAAILAGWEKPNFGVRSPTLCSSCRCCLILPEHREFWEKRLADNEEIVREERKLHGDKAGRTVADGRVAQCRVFIKQLEKVNASEFDDSV